MCFLQTPRRKPGRWCGKKHLDQCGSFRKGKRRRQIQQMAIRWPRQPRHVSTPFRVPLKFIQNHFYSNPRLPFSLANQWGSVLFTCNFRFYVAGMISLAKAALDLELQSGVVFADVAKEVWEQASLQAEEAEPNRTSDMACQTSEVEAASLPERKEALPVGEASPSTSDEDLMVKMEEDLIPEDLLEVELNYSD